MISVEIEKEIQQENKVILNQNLRQVVCLGIAAVLCIIISVFLKVDFTISVYPCLFIGGIAFAFGWYKQDCMPMERILMKKIQTMLYHNNVRIYRTKNQYIALMNQEYAKRKAKDLADKSFVKQMKREKKEQKKIRKRNRKSKRYVPIR